MTFVELSPSVLVDPTEVAVLVEATDGTRVYLRGSGARSWVWVDRPLAQVVAALDPRKRPEDAPRVLCSAATPAPAGVAGFPRQGR